jgi:N-acetylglucosamine-6-phosphate deacetylase
VKLVARNCLSGKAQAFQFKGVRVSLSAARSAKTNYLFGPAWTDLQCNGFAGVDFNHPGTTPVEVCQAIRAMWATGCATVLPTIITNGPDQIEHLFRVLAKALEIDPAVRACVPGFHLEGPFISPEDGARGAHPLEHVRPPDLRLWRRWQKAAGGLIRMVTLAPEVPRAVPFIVKLVSEGVVVAIGHTMVGGREIQRAAEAGARLSTHLGNGCPQLLHRHENPVLAQLGEDRLTATFIPDGIHLPPHVLRSFVRAKTSARSIIVTDAMAAAGAPPGLYTLAGYRLEVGPDRIVRQPGQPNFAGSALTMDEAVARYARYTSESVAESWIAGSTRADAVISHRSNAIVIVQRVDSMLRPIALIRNRRILWSNADPPLSRPPDHQHNLSFGRMSRVVREQFAR